MIEDILEAMRSDISSMQRERLHARRTRCRLKTRAPSRGVASNAAPAHELATDLGKAEEPPSLAMWAVAIASVTATTIQWR
eukprot:1959197-Rhodomonas_salina.1